MFNDAPTSRSPLRSRIAASIERQIARTGRSKSSGTIIRSAPISFADTAFTIPSLSLRDKIANEDAPGIHAPRHALSRATPFRNMHANGRKKRGNEGARDRRQSDRTSVKSPSILKNRTGTESAGLRFHCRCVTSIPRAFSTLRERVRRKGPRECANGPLSRVLCPLNTTGNATRRGEGRGSFETAMLPRDRKSVV